MLGIGHNKRGFCCKCNLTCIWASSTIYSSSCSKSCRNCKKILHQYGHCFCFILGGRLIINIILVHVHTIFVVWLFEHFCINPFVLILTFNFGICRFWDHLMPCYTQYPHSPRMDYIYYKPNEQYLHYPYHEIHAQ